MRRKKLKIILFPSPVPGNKIGIIIKANENTFNGKYNVSLIDLKGKLISNQLLNLDAANPFNYKISSLPEGQFILRLQNKMTLRLLDQHSVN